MLSNIQIRFFFSIFLFPFFSQAQNTQASKPKLVVGIVIDQMRADYLERFKNKFSEGGFLRMMKEGYNCANTHFNYVPTHTAPGHASIYTGTTPSYHGIIGNSWYDRKSNKKMYCTQDDNVSGLGTKTKEGRMSPKNMLSSTIADELFLATNKQSKIIGISLKDRGAILPAGHTAKAAYWFDELSGNWISSTYYADSLPEWVNTYNAKEQAKKYMSSPWNTLYPIEKYTESISDTNEYETPYFGELEAVFPHNIPALPHFDFEVVKRIPAGNTITKEMAIAAIEGEKLGMGNATDFLAVSFSSTDLIGHQFGVNSIEVQDTYLRLDLELRDFFNYLDQKIGLRNVLVFLTADHAAAQNLVYMKNSKLPAGIINSKNLLDSLEMHLNNIYGEGKWIFEYMNQQIYLNHNSIKAKKIDLKKIQNTCIQFLKNTDGIAEVLSSFQISDTDFHEGRSAFVKRGYYPKRSGDLCIQMEPYYADKHAEKGSTHGSSYNYDTHVPLLWFGWNISAGRNTNRFSITDIAPTLAELLKIEYPNASTGNPISIPLK